MEQSSRRKFLTAAGVSGATALAGCSGAQNALSGGSNPANIAFWHAMGGDTAKLIESMASDFESQADGVTVDVSAKGSYRDTLNATVSAVKSGNPPAVAQIFEIGTSLARDSGAFETVESIIPKSDLDKSSFLAPVRDYYTLDDTLHSMPFNSSNAVLYYNKDAFQNAGLDPEQPPKTYADLRAAAEALVKTNTTENGISFANHSWFVEQWFAEQNQPFVNAKNGRDGTPTKSNIASDAGKAVFDWWHGLSQDDLYLNPGVEAWSKAKEAFISQKVGMLVTSTSGIASTTAGAKQQGFDVGTGSLPVPNGNRHGVVIGGASLWVPKGLSDAQQQAAADFLTWLSAPEQQVRWHKHTGYFPVRTGAVDSLESDGWFEKHPNFKTAFDQLQATKDSPATRGAVLGPFTKTRTVVEQAFVSTSQGTSVDNALSAAQSKIDQAIDRYNAQNS